MKKRLLAVVLSGVLALSTLTACGGGDEAVEAPATKTASQEEAEEVEEEVEEVEESGEDYTEAAEDGAVSDETWDQLQDVYVALDEAYNATLDLYNSDEVAQDDSIEEALTQAEELMDEVGSIERADVQESDAESLVEAMLAINGIFDAVIGKVQPAQTASEDDEIDFTQIFTDCYAGITDDESTYAYLAFGDEISALLFYNEETKESGSFVGSYEMDEENGAIIITDENLGVTMTFTVEEADGGYYLDMGDVGAAFVEAVSSEDFVEAMNAISAGTEPQF